MRTAVRDIAARVALAAALLGLGVGVVSAQPGILTRELLIKYTPDWTGERFSDGRPKVPDGILERMKNVTLEEACTLVVGKMACVARSTRLTTGAARCIGTRRRAGRSPPTGKRHPDNAA